MDVDHPLVDMSLCWKIWRRQYQSDVGKEALISYLDKGVKMGPQVGESLDFVEK
jgi:hypothetical protein